MPDASLLEVFPTPTSTPFLIEHLNEEFTSVCPVTGHPDFGTILLSYEPSDTCVELKSLKLYYQSFRNEGIFYEAVTNPIAYMENVAIDDLATCLQPNWMQITTKWNGRGGIKSTIVASFGDVPTHFQES